LTLLEFADIDHHSPLGFIKIKTLSKKKRGPRLNVHLIFKELAPSIQMGLPRFQRAFPSASLDKELIKYSKLFYLPKL
jgi:hypothetical protein